MASSDEPSTLPERLQWALDHTEHTQASLAREIGISKGAVGQWMSGDTEHIRPAYLFDAARVLRVEAEWLATGRGARTSLERKAPDVDVEICRLVSAMPEQARTALLAMCIALMRPARA
jgi:transcriptional regulator with XRE-family HTH domain